MKQKYGITLNWLKHQPIAIINIVGLLTIIVGGTAYLAYELARPIDVLTNWTISVANAREYKELNGKKYPVYHPNDSFVFTSTSVKVIDTPGIINQVMICDATPTQVEREIQLDTIPATRPAGFSPVRESAITIPDVVKFEKLPRICRLVINIIYENVALYRDVNEHAESESFIVREQVLDVKVLRQQIKDLTNRVNEVESKPLE